MSALIPWQQLLDWVPGEVLFDSDSLDWKQVAVRSYYYQPQDVHVPAMQDFMIVAYRAGITPMQRRFQTRWTKSTLGPGATSLLTRAQSSHWMWQAPVEVTHIYLAPRLVHEVASEVMDCVVTDVELADVLRAEDPMMTWVGEALAREARINGLGGPLYADSIARSLIVHLLRSYASVQRSAVEVDGGLTGAQKRTIEAWVEAKLPEPMRLEAMAAAVGLTPCVFARLFRMTFGKPPYAFVIERRIARARRLLSATRLPIKQIAIDCGFSDQPHMTRLFRRTLGITPAKYRRDA